MILAQHGRAQKESASVRLSSEIYFATLGHSPLERLQTPKCDRARGSSQLPSSATRLKQRVGLTQWRSKNNTESPYIHSNLRASLLQGSWRTHVGAFPDL